MKYLEKLKDKKAITLIALVVTIVVLIILVAVVTAQITANGIINQAKRAGQLYTNAQEGEKDTLDNYDFQLTSTRDGADTNPIGTIIAYMGANAPEGYLVCDGTKKNVADYNELYNVLKDVDHTDWTEADWTTEFSLPNLQGQFLRGTGTNGYTDQGDGLEVGKHQEEGLPNISGTVGDTPSQSVSGAYTKSNGSFKVATGNGGAVFGSLTFNASRSSVIYGKSSHVTPTNMAVLYCIKAK